MKTVEFEIPGIPKGKQRPKVTVQGNYAHAYTPKETVNYENYVKLMYQTCKDKKFLEGAIGAVIQAIFPIPKSTSKKNIALMREGKIRHTKKIDCDNLAKIILDSLNGIAYKDDAQVCELLVCKYYGDEPKVEVMLYEIDPNEVQDIRQIKGGR